VIAAAAWVGGLVCLADALRRPLTADQAAVMARRFSALGLVTVSGLLASGVINTWFLVGSIGRLVGTGYGRVLMLKLALFVAMVAIAAVNRWHVVPRLAAAGAVSTLRRNALVEAALGMLAVMVVAWLGVQPPAAHMH
jgi:putative copper resistance protein D